MNKTYKAKNLPLFSIIDLDQLRRENIWRAQGYCDFFTGKGMESYLPAEQPSGNTGYDWLSTPPILAVEIQLIGRTAGCWKRRCFSWPLEVPVSLFAGPQRSLSRWGQDAPIGKTA